MTGQSDLQVLGQNSEAQEALKSIISETFPALEAEYNISDSVIAKFFDWFFPFPYTADGGGLRRWQVSVRAWCGRNKKLDALEDFYNASGTSGTFSETYGGEDTTTVTDTQSVETATNSNDNTENDINETTDFESESTTNISDSETNGGQATETTEENFNPVNTAASKLSGKTTRTTTPNTTRTATSDTTQNGTNKTTRTGSNTSSRTGTLTSTRTGKGGNVQTVYARGVSRTYSDGRTWTQIMNDIEAASAPVYSFINGFAQILIAPDDCYAPITCGVSMSATVGKVTAVAMDKAAVSVRNVGTPTNARFVFSFDAPQGVGIKSIKITEI